MDDEEIYLYSWLDPKNEGKVYTEEEAREEIGPNLIADKYIEELKEQGIVQRTYDENNAYFEEKVETLGEELKLTPYQMYGKSKEIDKANETEGLTRDEKLDKYYAEVLDEEYDRRGYMMIQDMMSNMTNITDFIQGDMQDLKGRFAEANKSILEYSLNNLDSVYYYISSNMIPAMEAVRTLNQLLKDRAELKRKLEDVQNYLEGLRDREPPKQVQMEQKTTQRDIHGNIQEITIYPWVNNVKHWEWQVEVQNYMEKERDLENQIEEKAKEAEKQLELVEQYENENIAFTNFVDNML